MLKLDHFRYNKNQMEYRFTNILNLKSLDRDDVKTYANHCGVNIKRYDLIPKLEYFRKEFLT